MANLLPVAKIYAFKEHIAKVLLDSISYSSFTTRGLVYK